MSILDLAKISGLFFMGPALALAQAGGKKPECDQSAVTRNCAFFSERSDQSEIKAGDGFFRNPNFISPPVSSHNQASKPVAASRSTYEASEAMYEKSILQQARTLEVLQKSDLPLKTQVALVPTLVMLTNSDPEAEVKIPWSEEGKFESVRVSEIWKRLEKKLSPAELEEVRKAAQEQQLEWKKNYEASVQLQMEAQKEQERAVQEHRKREDRLKARKARVEELFHYAKEKVKETLSRGRPESQLTAEERNALARVDQIKISHDEDLTKQCGLDGLNAFFNPKGVVMLCPAFLDQPDASIVQVLGHEIGHSIDPCNLSQPLWKVKPENLKKFSATGKLSEADKALLSELGEAGVHSGDIGLLAQDEFLQNKLVKAGALTLLQDPVAPAKYPFLKEQTCLIQEKRYHGHSPEDIHEAERYVNRMMKGESAEVLKMARRYKSALKKYPHCLRSPQHHSHMAETLSDLIGAAVFERYIEDFPLKTEEEKVGALSLYLTSCSPSETGNSEPSVTPLVMAKLFGNIANDSHLPSPIRIKLILGSDKAGEVYNCQPQKPSCLEGLSRRPGLAAKKREGVQ